MKKHTTTFFFVLFCLLFSTASWADRTVGFLVPVSGLGDQSFNDMTYAGLIQARASHDFRLIREQSEGFTEKSRKHAMDRLIDRDADIIVANGWEYRDVVAEYSRKYPKRIFIIHDFPLEGLPNVISTIYGQHEGSFLAGALAGWMSKSKKIGFIGGMDMPVIRAFQVGFRAGAEYVTSEIQVSEMFLSTPESGDSGFNNPKLGFKTANRMYNDGIDIIFGAAGLSGNGIIQAARQQQKFVIGVDADQDHMAKGFVLTSVIKRLDMATINILDNIFNGKHVQGVYSFGLKEAGVSLSPMTYTKHLIPEDVQKKIESLQQQIIAGEVKVPNPLEKN
ncbi:BMP family lipoprotein [Desulfosediminicola flagellatus]|uniref:BMP family lipoprotein n=1 Tax=Desulfosediminicola flagellatus TaxID=2569541 RepID=UPI0010AD5ABF|nr:BMP family ABC transporter substrate-binding protein [Desulfosediminicola flagellatus]